MPQVLFRVIKAKQSDFRAFYDEIAKTLDNEVKPALLSYFERVTKSWRNAQAFKATKRITLTEMSMGVVPVGPNRKIWQYVSQGTRGPYPIPKPGNKRAKTLRFRTGYKPRTTISGGYKGPGKATGKEILRKRVMHPGIKARNFERHIARWYAPQFRRTMKNAVARAIRRANRT